MYFFFASSTNSSYWSSTVYELWPLMKINVNMCYKSFIDLNIKKGFFFFKYLTTVLFFAFYSVDAFLINHYRSWYFICESNMHTLNLDSKYVLAVVRPVTLYFVIGHVGYCLVNTKSCLLRMQIFPAACFPLLK